MKKRDCYGNERVKVPGSGTVDLNLEAVVLGKQKSSDEVTQTSPRPIESSARSQVKFSDSQVERNQIMSRIKVNDEQRLATSRQ